MTARILVVDDVLPNLKLLEARLMAEYFDVRTATNGPDALRVCDELLCDIVLLDAMMPGMDGFEVCRRLKASPRTAHIPVIMVTALDQAADRVRGLEAGADDFLTKPVNDIALVTRVKSLVRLKMLTDELHSRLMTSPEFQRDGGADRNGGKDGRLLVVDDRPSSAERIVAFLSREHRVEAEPKAQEALFRAAENDYDLVIVSSSLTGFDALRVCSQLRSLERTRSVPILLVTEPEDNSRLLRGLELGVNDYVVRPIDRNELLARVRTQVRRKRFADKLRDSVQSTMEMALTDGLTSLHNRRYLELHLAQHVDQALARGRELSVFMLDIDHFKAINDTYGHDAGDDVLREFARRIRKNVRGIDLACRYGGEEFVIVMPETDIGVARLVAERLRQSVGGEAFVLNDGVRQLTVTVSVGIAALERRGDSPEKLLKRADAALYTAKREGRNRVVSVAA